MRFGGNSKGMNPKMLKHMISIRFFDMFWININPEPNDFGCCLQGFVSTWEEAFYKHGAIGKFGCLVLSRKIIHWLMGKRLDAFDAVMMLNVPSMMETNMFHKQMQTISNTTVITQWNKHAQHPLAAQTCRHVMIWKAHMFSVLKMTYIHVEFSMSMFISGSV